MSPMLLNAEQLLMQGYLCPTICREQKLPPSLHCQNIAALLPLQDLLFQLQKKTKQGVQIRAPISDTEFYIY